MTPRMTPRLFIFIKFAYWRPLRRFPSEWNNQIARFNCAFIIWRFADADLTCMSRHSIWDLRQKQRRKAQFARIKTNKTRSARQKAPAWPEERGKAPRSFSGPFRRRPSLTDCFSDRPKETVESDQTETVQGQHFFFSKMTENNHGPKGKGNRLETQIAFKNH